MHFDRIQHETLAGPGDGDPLLRLAEVARQRAIAPVDDEQQLYGLQHVAAWLRYPTINLFDWIIDHYTALRIRPRESREQPGGYVLSGREVHQMVRGLVSRGAEKLLQGDAAFSGEELARLVGVSPTQAAAIGRRLYGSEGQAFRVGRYNLWSLEQAEQIVRHALAGELPERRRRDSTPKAAPQGHLRSVAPISPPALPGPVPVPREELVQIERAMQREQGSSSTLMELLAELRPIFEADPSIPLNDLLDTLLDLHAGGQALLLRLLRGARQMGAPAPAPRPAGDRTATIERARRLTDKELKALSLEELQGVAQLLGQSGRGTKADLLARIRRAQKRTTG